MVAGDGYIVVNSHQQAHVRLHPLEVKDQGFREFDQCDDIVLSLATMGSRVIAGTQSGSLYIYRPDGSILSSQRNAHKKGISSVISHGKLIITASLDGLIFVWKFQTCSQPTCVKPHKARKWIKNLKKLVTKSRPSAISPLADAKLDGLSKQLNLKAAFRIKRPFKEKPVLRKDEGTAEDKRELELIRAMAPAEEDLYCMIWLGSLIATGGTASIVKVARFVD